jgi:hypothetical protein
MARADSNNTTTRRTLLKGLGPVVAVSLASGTAAAGAVTDNLASNMLIEPDLIFAAIAAHKDAQQMVDAAEAEINRLFALADETVGPCNISMPDRREPTSPGFHPYVTADCWIDVDRYAPPETHAGLNKLCRAELEERQIEYSDFLKRVSPDMEEIIPGPAAAECETCDRLAETVPTTTAGILALLIHADEIAAGDPDGVFAEQVLPTLLASAAKAAKALRGAAVPV